MAEFVDNQPAGSFLFSLASTMSGKVIVLRAGGRGGVEGRGRGLNGAEGGGFCGQSAGGTGVLFRSPAL